MLLLLVLVLAGSSLVLSSAGAGPVDWAPPGNWTTGLNVSVQDLGSGSDQNSTGGPADPADPGADSSSVQQLEEAETSAELLDFPVEEGDILLLEDRNAVSSRWKDAVVPVAISPGLADQKNKILAALKMIVDATCIRFKSYTNEVNYVRFQDGSGCASYVGQIGGGQPVFISSLCSVGNVCHEVIHALGFHHEHTREDRDQFVDIKWSNIIPKRRRHFRHKYGNMQSLPYDLNSIMHYGPYFFSKNGGQTLVSKVQGVKMGQRKELSPLDMMRLNQLYCDGEEN